MILLHARFLPSPQGIGSTHRNDIRLSAFTQQLFFQYVSESLKAEIKERNARVKQIGR